MTRKQFKAIAALVIIFLLMIIAAWIGGVVTERWFEWLAGIYLVAMIIFGFTFNRK
jgi:hypothetical protein